MGSGLIFTYIPGREKNAFFAKKCLQNGKSGLYFGHDER
jgi:hypothetical protein